MTAFKTLELLGSDDSNLPVAPEVVLPKDSFIQITPNPFGSISHQTSLSLVAPESGMVTVNVFNIKGQRITQLYRQEHQKFDEFTLSWDGKDEQHHDLGSGIYLFQLLVDDISYDIKKVVIIR